MTLSPSHQLWLYFGSWMRYADTSIKNKPQGAIEMEANELYDQPSRIHWTAIVGLCSCVITALDVISIFFPLMDFEQALPPPIWTIPSGAVFSMIFGCIALFFAQKPAWKRGLRLTVACLIFGSVLIQISLLLIIFVSSIEL